MFRLAAGVGVGGTAGIAGGIDVSVLTVTTQAYIEGEKTVDDIMYTGAAVDAGGSVVVSAEEKTQIDVIGGSIAAGGTAGIGGAVALPVVVKHTYAYIGNGAEVDAAANYAGIDVRTGEFNESFVDPSGDGGEVSPVDIDNSDADDTGDESYSKLRVASPVTRTGFQGVAVTAINQDDIGAYGVGAGLAGTVAVQISATVQVMSAETLAYIGDDAQINMATSGEGSNQSVLVAAGNNYGYLGIAGAIGISGAVAVTPGAEVDVVVINTKAYIGNGADVQAMKDVEVRAESAEDVLSIAIAIAGSGTVSVAGTVSVVAIVNTTYAFIDDYAVVDAGGNVLVSAADATDVDTVAGAIAIGIAGAGVGAGIGVTVVDKDTQAYIGQYADVDARGNSSYMTVYNGELDESTGAFGLTGATDNVHGLVVVAVIQREHLCFSGHRGWRAWRWCGRRHHGPGGELGHARLY